MKLLLPLVLIFQTDFSVRGCIRVSAGAGTEWTERLFRVKEEPVSYGDWQHVNSRRSSLLKDARMVNVALTASHEDARGSGGTGPLLLDLGIRWRWG